MTFSKIITYLLSFTLCCSSFNIYAQTTPIENLCKPKGYQVNFINGMYQTESEAQGWIDDIQRYKIAGLTSKKEGTDIKYLYKELPVTFDLQYNHSESLWRDLMEVFKQKSRELPDFNNRWENFWLATHNVSSALIGLLPVPQKGLIDYFKDTAFDITKKKMEQDIMASNNFPNVFKIRRSMEDQMFEGKRVIAVAHSQGNLISQQVWRDLNPKYKNGEIRFVHLGTPVSSTIVDNDYVTATKDVVINSLRLTLGAGSVLPGNVAENYVWKDGYNAWGMHVYPYLYPTYTQSYAKVLTAYKKAFDTVKQDDEIAPTGSFNISMTWNGTGDIDLHVIEPSGKEVYYSNKQGDSGYLDTDNTSANGPEHYNATCDATKLKAGTYQVFAKNYARGNGKIAYLSMNSPFLGKSFPTKSTNFSQEKQKNKIFDIIVKNEIKDKKRIFEIEVK